jgi:hypothetical protein
MTETLELKLVNKEEFAFFDKANKKLGAYIIKEYKSNKVKGCGFRTIEYLNKKGKVVKRASYDPQTHPSFGDASELFGISPGELYWGRVKVER